MITSHSLSIAHQLAHAEHEQLEPCESLELLNAGNDCILAQSPRQLLSYDQHYVPLWFVSTLEIVEAQIRPSRAPPISEISNLTAVI